MSDEAFESVLDEADRRDLQGLIEEQLVASGCGLPAESLLVEEGAILIVILSWWEAPPAEAFAAAAPALAELVALRRRREVEAIQTTLNGDGRHGLVCLVLGAATADEWERAAALCNWSAQVRRNARAQRARYRRRRIELRRERAELIRARLALRGGHRARLGAPARSPK